jgi:hypothetical protein
MKEQRFQVGDKVTYKDMHELPNEKYFYSGRNQKGYVGTITSYESFIEERNCYRIQVSTSITNFLCFSMLESEFEEYDVVQEEHKFKVGDAVTTHKFYNCNVIFSGSMVEYVEKKGNISLIDEERCIAYVHGCWWPFSAIKLASEEPGSKFNIGDVVNITGEGYQYTSMDRLASSRIHDWTVITCCNCRPPFRSNIVVKDKVYSSIQDKWWYKFDEFCGNWTSECGISPITPVVNPMDAILEEAIRKYPVGTKYIPIPLTLNGSVYIREEKVAYTPRITGTDAIEGGIGYLYAQGEWAEIVPETESVFKDAPNIQSGSSVTSSGTSYNPITFLGVTTPTIATIGTGSWGFTDSGFSISPCSEIPKPIQNTMPDEDIVHRENTIKAMQL